MHSKFRFLFISAVLLLGSTARAGYFSKGKILTSPDDAQTEAFGVGVEDYSGTGGGNLQFCIDAVQSWIGHLESAGVANWHYCTDPNGWSTDWENSGGDDVYNDAGDLSYFCGHGSSGRFYFNGSKGDDLVSASETRWGNNDVEVVAIDACQVLDASGRTSYGNANINDGVHYILGFDSNALDIVTTGQYFGYYLRNGYSVRSAWNLATREGHSSSFTGAYVRFTSQSCDTYGDSLFGMAPCNPTSTTKFYTSTWTL